MKEYIAPSMILVWLEEQDICTFSAPSSPDNATFDDYIFDDGMWF